MLAQGPYWCDSIQSKSCCNFVIKLNQCQIQTRACMEMSWLLVDVLRLPEAEE